MFKAMNYQIHNDLSPFVFHDAIFDLVELSTDQLVFEVRAMNIQHGHPCNPGACDMEIAHAQIVFISPSELTAEIGRYWENGMPVGERVILKEQAAIQYMENVFSDAARVYTFTDDTHQFIMDCGNHIEPFTTFIWKATSMTVSWNGYKGPAWYVNPQEK